MGSAEDVNPASMLRERNKARSELFGILNQNGHAPVASTTPPDISRTSTPIPPDALPSVYATSSARKYIRDQQKKRMFPTVEYTQRVSHFDPDSEHRDFRGFFVLFWIGLAIMVLTTILRNMKQTGVPFQMRQKTIFLQDLWELGPTDLAMTASAALSLPLHKLYANSGQKWLLWKNGGIWIQSAFQIAWLLYWVNWPFMRNWTWTAQVFFTLHLLALFMKMHSYAFYNGHLSEVKRRLDDLDAPVKPLKRMKLVRYPSSTNQLRDLTQAYQEAAKSAPSNNVDQLREDLAVEITSPLGNFTYPNNLTVRNFIDYLCCPTLCYELEYPRTSGIRPMELFYKTLAVFGCIFILTITSEEFIMPVLDEAAIRLSYFSTTDTLSLSTFALVFVETISRLLFPFMVTFLLVFLVIFEYILGAFAEITCFGDRHFYSDWWNSCDWLEFSREWNIPVHNFFRRHVYAASRSVVSRELATVITFAISAAAHELVMGCITKKLRGYGAFAMMLQMPIVLLQRSRWLKGRTLLNNVLFWCSMISGLSIMCALYVLL